MVRDATRCLEGKAPVFGLRLIVQPRPPPASQEDPTMPYVPKRTVLVEFTVHSGNEILRDGEWAGDWTAAEASVERK